jgi:hypothetical protein
MFHDYLFTDTVPGIDRNGLRAPLRDKSVFTCTQCGATNHTPMDQSMCKPCHQNESDLDDFNGGRT